MASAQGDGSTSIGSSGGSADQPTVGAGVAVPEFPTAARTAKPEKEEEEEEASVTEGGSTDGGILGRFGRWCFTSTVREGDAVVAGGGTSKPSTSGTTGDEDKGEEMRLQPAHQAGASRRKVWRGLNEKNLCGGPVEFHM